MDALLGAVPTGVYRHGIEVDDAKGASSSIDRVRDRDRRRIWTACGADLSHRLDGPLATTEARRHIFGRLHAFVEIGP